MYIISALGLHGLSSSLTPMEHHAHPLGCTHLTLETTGIVHEKPVYLTALLFRQVL
jgi:hypothetical protein